MLPFSSQCSLHLTYNNVSRYIFTESFSSLIYSTCARQVRTITFMRDVTNLPNAERNHKNQSDFVPKNKVYDDMYAINQSRDNFV